MSINEAIALRMKQLAHERYVTLNEIIKRGKINQSTISEMMQGRSKHPRVSTILKFCRGCNITMSEFFDSELFDELALDNDQKNEESTTNEESKNNLIDEDIPFAAKMPFPKK